MSRIAQLERLLAADERDPDLLYMMAIEHAKAGDAAEAIRWFDRCLEADPQYCYAHYHKALTQRDANELDAARETLRAGLRTAREIGNGKAEDEIVALLDQIGA